MAAERKLITNLHKMYIFCTPFISENILREGPMKEPFDFEFNGLSDHLLGLYKFLYELLSTLESCLDVEDLRAYLLGIFRVRFSSEYKNSTLRTPTKHALNNQR